MFRLFFLLLLSLLLEAEEGTVIRQKVLMGTFVILRVESSHSELIEPSFKLLSQIEKSLSSFHKHSPIYKLNHDRYAQLDNDAYAAIEYSLQYYKDTDGYFNIAIGKMTKDLYSFGENEKVPDKKALQVASTDITGLFLNKKKAMLTGDIKIDLGGMGKGYGVDKVVTFLKTSGVKKAVIALSGDIRCLGSCFISVHNPLDDSTPLATFRLRDSGVSTSGNYNRFVKERKYNHLINPKTKESESNFLSVTLISKLSSTTLDAYSTAVSVMPKKKAYRFLKSHNLAYVILESDMSLHISQNIDDYVDDLNEKQ